MDHYATLGIKKTASPDEIKKAFRRLASQHHPDKGGDTAKFQKVQEAYAVLSDPDKRVQYDNPQPQGMPPGFGARGFNFNGDINDLFSQIFEGGGRGNPFNFHQNHRQILRTQVQISLQQAYTGHNQVLKLNTNIGNKVINIEIPPGVKTGDQVKYENILDNATLLVEFVVLPDLKFDRRGQDLYSNHPISVLDLITGTTFEFDTISGKTVQVYVPPKTQPFMQLKLTGHGMPIPNSDQLGDQLILIKPFIPDNIHEEIVNSINQYKDIT
jgi:DnaJ-class molecular chaperone